MLVQSTSLSSRSSIAIHTGLSRQQKAQLKGQAQLPLYYRLLREDLTHQQRRTLHHPCRPAVRAEPEPLAAKRHELLRMTALTAHAQKAVLQSPALLDLRREACYHELAFSLIRSSISAPVFAHFEFGANILSFSAIRKASITARSELNESGSTRTHVPRMAAAL